MAGWDERNVQINGIRANEILGAAGTKSTKLNIKKNSSLTWLKMIGIILTGITLTALASTGIGALVEAGTIGVVGGALTEVFVNGILDITTNFLSEAVTGRLSPSRIFLTSMPIIGVEFLGKLPLILRVKKRMEQLIQGVSKVSVPIRSGYKNVRANNILKVKKNVINYMKKNMNMFVNRDVAITKKYKFAYVNGRGANLKQYKYMQGLEKMVVKNKYQSKLLKQHLWKEFGDRSVFNENIFLSALKPNGKFQKNQNIKTIIDRQGGAELGEAITKKITEIQDTFFSPMRDLPNRFGIKGSARWLYSKTIGKIVKKESIKKPTEAKPNIVFLGIKEVIEQLDPKKTMSRFDKFNVGVQTILKAIASYTAPVRYLDPVLLLRRLGKRGTQEGAYQTKKIFNLEKQEVSNVSKTTRKTKIVSTFQINKRQTTLSQTYQEKFKKMKEGIKSRDKLLKAKSLLWTLNNTPEGKSVYKITLKQITKQMNLIPVRSRWIIGYRIIGKTAMFGNQEKTISLNQLQIFFNPWTTAGKRKNIGGKKPIITAPMTHTEILKFVRNPGRYYLKNIAYGRDWFDNNLASSLFGKWAPLRVQRTVYQAYRIKRDFVGGVRAFHALRKAGEREWGQTMRNSIAPILLRSGLTEFGVGRWVNSWVGGAIQGKNDFLLSGGRTFISRRVNVFRRRQIRKQR